MVLLAAGACSCWGRQRRNLKDHALKMAEFKKRMFERNGGSMLQQQISSLPGNNFRIFTVKELAKATDGFSDEHIIGRGGHGVVYLGKLEDNTAVAIKKSKMMDERESKEFAREMAIFSQINHINVVKILGCCVEVEVPKLVYEFVPGGTLFDLIHGGKGRNPISLWVSLRIAKEVAEALAYLHSYASPPILHKDVKTSNVLLDENNKAKISDFGASSVAPVDEYEIATVVQGTCGYLDPEYLQTYHFTDKSDVYSFGVILVELLTRRKPLQLLGPEDQKGLATTFISFLNQGKLENIIELEILEEADGETLRHISHLAGRCLCVKRTDRPTMKEVSMALQILGSTHEHPWVPEHTLPEEKSQLNPDLPMACEIADVSNSCLETNYHPFLDIEGGR